MSTTNTTCATSPHKCSKPHYSKLAPHLKVFLSSCPHFKTYYFGVKKLEEYDGNPNYTYFRSNVDK